MAVPAQSRFEKGRRRTVNETRFREKMDMLRKSRTAKTRKQRDLYQELAQAPHLQPAKFPDLSYRDLEMRTGFPSTLGYTRQRPSYRTSAITTNR
jgi:hypothetical protein